MTHAFYMRTDEIPKCDSLSNAEFVLRNWPRRTSTKPFRFESASNAQKYMINRGGANSDGCTEVIHANSAECANQSRKNRIGGTGTRSGIFAAVLGAFAIFSSCKNVIMGCKCHGVFNRNQPRKVTQKNGL